MGAQMISPANMLNLKNPDGVEIQLDFLQEFERGLDALNPEKSQVPCRILGYGEISTVFEIQVDGLRDLAFKRMCIFQTPAELESYIATYHEYIRRLQSEAGLHLPANGYASFERVSGQPVFYIIQKKLPPASIGSAALSCLSPQGAVALARVILQELDKVWRYNCDHPGARVGIDGQISNWAIQGFDQRCPSVEDGTVLLYLDTSTPLLYQDGVEQLDPELFLRSAPPYLVWILRLLFLKDVMTRYYDPRKVIIDLLANVYKEQKSEFVPEMVAAANEFIAHQAAYLGLLPVTVKEVADYYREDAVIWSLYLAMRRFDRFVRRKALRRDYPYILPGKIKR
jgi:hypothetical protein